MPEMNLLKATHQEYAPPHYDQEQSDAWVSGYNTAVGYGNKLLMARGSEIARLREQVEGLSRALKDVDELIIHTCRPCPAPVNPPHICDCTLGDAHRLIASKLTQR